FLMVSLHSVAPLEYHGRAGMSQIASGPDMRVLVYGLNYAPEPTGTGKYTGEMVSWMVNRQHGVSVICGLPHYPQWVCYGEASSRVEMMDGASIQRASHYVPSADQLDARTRIRLETTFTISAARYWLRRFVRRQKPDVVIAVTP